MTSLGLSELDLQTQKFSKFINDRSINLDAFTKGGNTLLSFATQFNRLSNFEKRVENHIDDETSGESSPCHSDEEKQPRYLMPTQQEVAEVLTEELCLEVDYATDKLKDFSEKYITLLFEGFEQSFRKDRFKNMVKNLKVRGLRYDDILEVQNCKDICFKESTAILFSCRIRKPDYFYDFITILHTFAKSESKRPIKISIVIKDRIKSREWFAVIVRNIPPKVTQKELLTQCQREVTGQVNVGTFVKIKDKYCCIIRCDYLEDAEFICRRLNNFQLKDPQTYIKYVMKAYLHPQCSMKHKLKDKSMFLDYFKFKGKYSFEEKVDKTSYNELLDIFKSSKKSNPPEKFKPVEPSRHKESFDKLIPEPSPQADSLLQRITKSPINQEEASKDIGHANGEPARPSVFDRIIKSSTPSTATNVASDNLNFMEKISQHNPDNGIQEERPKPPSDMPQYYGEQANKSYEEGRRSPFNKDKPHYRVDTSGPRKRFFFHNKEDEGFKQSRQLTVTKKSPTKKSHSKSKSRSRSRSKSKSLQRNRDRDYKNNRYSRSPKRHRTRRSNSRDHRKKNYKDSRSKSSSKSRSRSDVRGGRRDDKEDTKPMKTTMFEYNVKGNKEDEDKRNEKSRSRSKYRRRNDSRSTSKQRYQNRKYDDRHTSRGHYDYKNKDRERERDKDRGYKYNDHKQSYKRDYDRKYDGHHSSGNRKYDNDRDDYKRNRRDDEHRRDSYRHRNRSKSRSRSKNRRSRSRSESVSKNRYDKSYREGSNDNRRRSPQASDMR